MTKQNKIQLFQEQKVRTHWDEEKEKWYFSIVDVTAILTESKNPQAYWRKLKQRLKQEGNETVTNCHALKMQAADGKMRNTDVADTEQLLRLIQSIPSPKAELFKMWLAKVGAFRSRNTHSPLEAKQNIGGLMVKMEVRLFSLLLILLFLFLGGCATQQKVLQQTSEKIDLKYNFSYDNILRYKTINTLKQTMEVRGNKVSTEVEKKMEYTIAPTKQDAYKAMLEFTINNASMDISQPNGDMEADLNSIIGKSFSMLVNEVGKESDYTNMDSITYFLGPSEQSIVSDFQTVFPDLPEMAINIDDSWTAIDTIKVKSATTAESDFEMIMFSEYSLKAFELIEDRNCVKIVCATTANLLSNSTVQGMDLITKVEMKGKETIYFDYGDGILVKVSAEISGSGSITAMGEEEMIIPLEQKITYETVVVE